MTGKMANPPIFYTIGVLTFNAVLDMESYIPKIQKDMRKAFPDFSQDITTNFQVNLLGNKPEIQSTLNSRWHFKDASKTSGYAITPTSVMFHTTAYEDSDRFTGALVDGLLTVDLHVGLSYLDSVAVRVLDAVIPKEGEDLSTYLQPGALGLRSVHDGKLLQSFTQSVFEVPNGQLTTRAIVLNGKIGIPLELSPITLQLADRILSLDQPHVVLDNDCQSKERSVVDAKDIEKRIRSVKAQTKLAFDRSVTTRALEIWNTL